MKKIKIFKTTSGSLDETEHEINDFLDDKELISLTQSQSTKENYISVIFTLVYEDGKQNPWV